MTYADTFKNAVQVANSNWHNSQISFSPDITWRDDKGRHITIGYPERQWAAQADDKHVVIVEPADGSAPDFCPIDCTIKQGVHDMTQIARDEDGKFSAYVWPGGYPLYEVMDDGESLCVKCANSDAPVHLDPPDDGWRIVASDVNYEDPDLHCCHCGDRIESAYAEEN